MRRRNSINIWPAFADLMTVLAVVGFFTTIAVSRLVAPKDELIARNRELERGRRKLVEQQRNLEQKLRARERDWADERAHLHEQVQEAARNHEMFQAIQEAQTFIDDISKNSGLAFSADQSLQFGDDLVTFDLNSLKPKWTADGRDRLRRFCEAISNQRAESRGSLAIKDLFVVHVEGHTDSTGCPGDPSCNWWISSGRAAAFVSLMRQSGYCPGGSEWNLRPIGYADTNPMGRGEQPTRRIAVKLVPNYERLIAARWKE